MTQTPNIGNRTQTRAQHPDTLIYPAFALIASSDEEGLEAALVYADQNTDAVSPYPIYLTSGSYDLVRSLVIRASIELWGENLDTTFIRQAADSGIGPGQMNTMIKVASGSSLRIDNLTLLDGETTTIGAAIYMEPGSDSLTVTNARFTNNFAFQDGGAIFNQASGQVVLENVGFEGNTADRGGAIFNLSNRGTEDAIRMKFVDFKNNQANESGGGALMNGLTAGTIHIRKSNFRNNYGASQSAIRQHIHVQGDGLKVSARKSYWNNPTVAESSNLQGVDTLNQDPKWTIPITNPAFNVIIVDTGSRAWAAEEKTALLTALYRVGLAYRRLSSNPAMAQDHFNRVLTSGTGSAPAVVLFVRAQDSTDDGYGIPDANNIPIPDVPAQFVYDGQTRNVIYEDISVGYCKAFPAGTFAGVARPPAVVCNGSLLDNHSGAQVGYASEYTIVHELGHVFDDRTGVIVNNEIEGGLTLAFGLHAFYRLEDCTTARVMGDQSGSNDWTRGERGWGSGPAASQRDIAGTPTAPLISNYQQNPLFVHATKDTEEINEAAADMFLNWIFRVNADPAFPPTDTCAQTPTPTPNHWLGDGFLNASWTAQTASVGTTLPGNLDGSLPGDRRHYHTHQIMTSLFAANPTW